jgi:hypothetical protein
MGDTTGKKDVDNRLGLPFLGGKEFLLGLQPKKVPQSQPQSPDHPDLQKTAAGMAFHKIVMLTGEKWIAEIHER